MAGITGQGTTFNLPNYVGELFGISPEDTPFLTAIGGLTGGRSAQAKRFDWEFYDLRAPAERDRLEGAAAPSADNRVRSNDHNVVQIIHEAVSVSYTKLAAVGQRDGTGVPAGSNPVTNEYDRQVSQALKAIARDTENAFVNGSFLEPADNTVARRTRGLLQAITTNVKDMSNTVPTVDDILDLLQEAYFNGGLQEGETRTLMVGPGARRLLTKLFVNNFAAGYFGTDRNIGGTKVTSIETDFGNLNIMLNRFMPHNEIVAVSLEDCAPVMLEIPGKGFLFLEPLAKTGSSQDAQIYGEIGLEYGNQRKHAKMINVDTKSGGLLGS